jgi:hypothetical protein
MVVEKHKVEGHTVQRIMVKGPTCSRGTWCKGIGAHRELAHCERAYGEESSR